MDHTPPAHASSSTPPQPNSIEHISHTLMMLQNQIQQIGERVNNLDTNANPPPRRQPFRGLNHPQDVRVPFQAPDLGDDDQADPYLNPRRRDPVNRNRPRDEDHFINRDNNRDNTRDIKLSLPTFAGTVDPDAYLDWERRMDYIFDCYGYSERKKLAVAAAQLTEFALSWWDREVSEIRRNLCGQVETWQDMKFYLKKRYLPPHYHHAIQKRFRNLHQGNRSVEEYFEEFEQLRNRLELEDTEEALMAQFADGLQERIARKVERQPYHQLNELLHLAIQIELQQKTKTTHYRHFKQTTWTPQVPTSADKGKSSDKGKAPITSTSKNLRFDQPKP